MSQKTAVLLMAYGGPNSLEDVEPYLLDVRGGRPTSQALIDEVRERYAVIGGKSPLLEITCRQAEALEERLNQSASGPYQVFVGMRHWTPYIRDVVDQIAQAGITRILALCMTPFSSRISTGAYFDHLQRAIETHDETSPWRQALTVHRVGAWFDHPTYVRAIAVNVRDGIHERGSTPFVLFTTHSLPAALVEQGDPYAEQFEQLAGLVAKEAGLAAGQWMTCYQSAGAQNTRWLGPSLEETIDRLASEGQKSILVAPLGFLSDHVEILFDIDIEAQQIAEQTGVELSRIHSLNDQPLFIQALSEITQAEEKSW